MKAFVAVCIVLALLAVPTLGLSSMGHNGMEHSGCLAAAVQGSDCPIYGMLADSLAFHAGAVAKFSTALLVAALMFMGVFVVFGQALFQPDRLAVFRRRRDSFGFALEPALVRWLSLHENSPASS